MITTLPLWFGITWQERQQIIKEARARIEKAEEKRREAKQERKAEMAKRLAKIARKGKS